MPRRNKITVVAPATSAHGGSLVASKDWRCVLVASSKASARQALVLAQAAPVEGFDVRMVCATMIAHEKLCFVTSPRDCHASRHDRDALLKQMPGLFRMSSMRW